MIPDTSDSGKQKPTWPPAYLDLRGVCHETQTSVRQVRRLLASGRLPAADVNVSATGSAKGRRWNRAALLAFIAGGRRE